MTTISNTSGATVAGAAGVRPAAGRGLSRMWIYGGVGLVIALGLIGVASGAGGFFSRLFGSSVSEASVYTVHPTSMRISLMEDGELKPKRSVEVKCELEGQSTIIWVVPESTHVNAGEPLVELASDEIKARIEEEEIQVQSIRADFEAAQQDLSITLNENASKIKAAEIKLEIADLELARYMNGDYIKALKAADIEIRQAQLDIKQREDEYQKNERLAARGFVTPTKLEELRIALEKARMTLDKATLERQILEDYEKRKNEKEKNSALDQAREELTREKAQAQSRERQARSKLAEKEATLGVRDARLNRMKDQLGKAKIAAPVDGVVQYAGDSNNWRMGGSRVAAGEKAYEGQVLIVLPDTSQMIVSTRIHEADRHSVGEGLPCRIKVPAVPGRFFEGKVAKIARFADSEHRWLNPELKEHATEIVLDATDAPLSPGDTAEIEILIEELSDVLAVPVQSVYPRGSKRFVFATDASGTRPVEIKTGRSNTTMVQVVSGLSSGDRVMMSATEQMLASLPVVKEEAVAMVPPPEAPAAGGPGGGGGGQRGGGGPGMRSGGGGGAGNSGAGSGSPGGSKPRSGGARPSRPGG